MTVISTLPWPRSSSSVVQAVSILVGDGDGYFQLLPSFSIGAIRPAGLAAADFNGDGKLDLAACGQGSPFVYIMVGNGRGAFQPEMEFALPSGCDSLAVGDFNGDGRLDLAVTGSLADTVSIMLGRGDGTLQTSRNYSVGLAGDAVVGTFNNTALPDVAAGIIGISSSLVVLANTTERRTLATPAAQTK